MNNCAHESQWVSSASGKVRCHDCSEIIPIQHTPGPWTITDKPSQDGTGSFFIRANKYKSGWIAEAKGTHVGPKSLDEAHANACLIAAAPEMLEALKGLMARIEEGTLVRDISRDHESGWSLRVVSLVSNVKAAQDAIVKAEGRSE